MPTPIDPQLPVIPAPPAERPNPDVVPPRGKAAPVVDPGDVLTVVAVAIAMCLSATVYPAWVNCEHSHC